MRISTLTPADAGAYRTLTLEAYAQAPDAFTSTVAERGGRRDEEAIQPRLRLAVVSLDISSTERQKTVSQSKLRPQ